MAQNFEVRNHITYKWILKSLSAQSLFLYLLFKKAYEENYFSLKYVDEKSNRAVIASFANTENSFKRNQKPINDKDL